MNHNPDILDQLQHSLDRFLGPRFRRLVEDSIIEIEQLRAQLTEQGNPVNHNPEILKRLHHAQPLTHGPYLRLVNDTITEIEGLRAQLTQQGNPVNHNPDIPETFIATTNIDLLRTAGNNLERQLMKLHANYHGSECETCQTLITWWTINGR